SLYDPATSVIYALSLHDALPILEIRLSLYSIDLSCTGFLISWVSTPTSKLSDLCISCLPCELNLQIPFLKDMALLCFTYPIGMIGQLFSHRICLLFPYFFDKYLL